MPPPPPKLLLPLESYLQASKKACLACLKCIEPTTILDGTQANVHLYYVRFDESSEPKVEDLAYQLVRHIVRYSLSTRTRETLKDSIDDFDDADLFLRARDLFRRVHDAGEVGELLLFFLLEAFYEAPQVICKMELKTNSSDEVKGADGVHVRWDEHDSKLNIYIGESKLHASIYSALSGTLSSIGTFYESRKKSEELALVTAHFKHTNDAFKNAVLSYINNEDPGQVHRVIHPCLVGWDWDTYKAQLKDPVRFCADFERTYLGYLPNIEKMLSKRFADFRYKHLRYDFLFLPFPSVDDFRTEFYRILSDGRKRR